MGGPQHQLNPDEDTIEYMSRFVKLFKSRNMRAIFVMWRRPMYWKDTFDKLLKDADPSRWIAVDYNPFLLRQHGNEFWLKNDPSHHPSPQGHLWMAVALCNTILEHRMLDP